MTTLANLTKAEAVYREARWRILTGQMPPGAPVNQAELAAEFGMSPTPVREALRRLESEGLVVFIAHAMVMVAPLDLCELDELYAIRVELDSFAGRLAAENLTRDDAAALKKLLRPSSGTLTDRFERNREFHRSVYRASHNAQLIALLDQLWDRTERYRIVLVANEASERGTLHVQSHSHEDHRAIAAALVEGDAERVGNLLRRHVQLSHDLIRSVLENEGSGFIRGAGDAVLRPLDTTVRRV
jgi:DNA-binding GntR family transcriptional regulator